MQGVKNHNMTINLNDLPTNPFPLFKDWLEEAGEKEPAYANAMTLATSGKDGRPSARTVLLKGYDENGFVFYTNSKSHKGRDLKDNPQAELLFYWKSTEKQIRVSGSVEMVTNAEADAYFASRPRDAQIGAWASQQSEELDNRETFEKAIADITAKYDGQAVPRPPHWTGYRVIPDQIEFWVEVEFRLHHRYFYERAGENWIKKMLYP